MIHSDLYHQLWMQHEDARTRDLEFRRVLHEASKARIEERRPGSGDERTTTRRHGFIDVAIRLLQVGVSWIV
jgi:hypothetical protein